MKTKLQLLAKNNLMILAFVILGLVSYHATRPTSEPKETFLPEPKSVDTFIPRGFSLVPIEVANADSLASLIGDVGGVVDLYLASTEKQKGGLKVGSKLKLLRAPLNPQQYAVLIRDTESSRLLSYTGPFIAVVQNPEETGAQLTSSSPAKIRVEYQN
ncbi:hypothetical protein AZI85_08515 [Bdellovibrio bacteriovorus]|uniref:Flp pilus assembly protein RcpC/CpaB domain-containing protein n=1 Tax=Bdellovibrio bacteriovorus TaxID=959 RepID=A0A150WH07_BDEBC|nr:hypothetical protein [Bdellovibrio bacteriovorus]KYG62223.1 hypothetical protein AZI85_08515 [Bdellovibrio bacteriovorus]